MRRGLVWSIRLAGRPARQSEEANCRDRKVTKDDTRPPSRDQAMERTYEVEHGMTSREWQEGHYVSQAPFSQERAEDELGSARLGSRLKVKWAMLPSVG